MLRRLVRPAAVVIGIGVAVTGCSSASRSAAATVGHHRITIATLDSETANLSQAVAKTPGSVRLSATQLTRDTLTWLIRFQINDEVGRQNGITVTAAQAQAGLARVYALAQSETAAAGLKKPSLTEVMVTNGIPPDLQPDLARSEAIEAQFIERANGGKLPTTNSAETAVMTRLDKARCVAAKKLRIFVSPQFGRLDYGQFQVVSAAGIQSPAQGSESGLEPGLISACLSPCCSWAGVAANARVQPR